MTLSTASVYPRRAAFAFEVAAELGYDGVEVMVWSDEATQDPAALTRLADDHGVPVRSIHAPTLLVSQRVWGRAPASKLRRTVDMAGELGASTVVVHPPFRWQYKYARQFQDLVHELNESGEVTVAVENMYPWRPRSKGDRELKAYLPGWDPADHDYDAVTLDLSHAAVAQQDGLALVAEFGDRVAHGLLGHAAGAQLTGERGTGQPPAVVARAHPGAGEDGVVDQSGPRALLHDRGHDLFLVAAAEQAGLQLRGGARLVREHPQGQGAGPVQCLLPAGRRRGVGAVAVRRGVGLTHPSRAP